MSREGGPGPEEMGITPEDAVEFTAEQQEAIDILRTHINAELGKKYQAGKEVTVRLSGLAEGYKPEGLDEKMVSTTDVVVNALAEEFRGQGWNVDLEGSHQGRYFKFSKAESSQT